MFWEKQFKQFTNIKGSKRFPKELQIAYCQGLLPGVSVLSLDRRLLRYNNNAQLLPFHW